MDIMVLLFVTLQVFSCAAGYPTGAPTSACVDMMPKHGDVQPQPTPTPYKLHPSNSSFQTGKPVTVVIKGPDYRGVLLEARSGTDSSAVGTWQTPPANTKFLQCSGNKQGAITHANTQIKNNSTVYTWIPPATVTSVYFMATVAQQRTVYWVHVMSETLNQSEAGGTSLNVHDSTDPLRAISSAAAALLLLQLLLPHAQFVLE